MLTSALCYLLSTVCLVRKILIFRIFVISLATTIKKSHCNAAVTHVMIRIASLTLASPLLKEFTKY